MIPLGRVYSPEHFDILFAFFWFVDYFLSFLEVHCIFISLTIHWIFFLVHETAWLGVPRGGNTSHCALGPAGPAARFEGGRARARCRAPATAMAGGTGHARMRGWARSTRETTSYPKVAAPLAKGHRRRRQRQWRTADGGAVPLR